MLGFPLLAWAVELVDDPQQVFDSLGSLLSD